MADLTPNQRRVLKTMNGIRWEGSPAVCSFKLVASKSGLSRPSAKRAVRQLADMGLAEYSAMFNDDGMICGSGYMLTSEGEAEASVSEEGDRP